MLTKNSELLKQGTIEIAEESEKAVVDVQTLQKTNQDIIDTLDKVIEIHENGRVKRQEAEVQLEEIENKLKVTKSEELMIMWNELGLSGGTAIIILIALYFVIKWAVKNGIKEAYSAITGKKTEEDVRNEKELKELGFELEDK